MQQVIHSPFLQALGYAILNSLWQFALLWLIYVGFNSLRKLNSHQKYVTGLVVQIGGFTWFIGTLFFYYSEGLALADSFAYLQNDRFSITNSATATGKEKLLLWVLQTEQLLPYLSLAYLTLLLLLVTRCVKAYKYTQSVRNNGLKKIDVEWRLFVQQLSFQLGIGKEVKIYLSELVKTPLTIGFYKPLILIPLASINHLTTDQMEAVILHELAHIKRFDYLLNLFLTVIEAAMFFNPFMQLISIQIKRERENCCDDWVLQFEYNAASYARALLQIASSQSSSPVFALKATDERQALLNRIKRMIERKEKTFFNYKHQVLALIVMTTVLSALALFSKKNTLFTVKPSGLLTPLVAKVDHPLFNPVFFLLNNSTELNPIELDAKINKGEKEVAALKRSKDSTTTNITNIKEDRTEKNLQQLRKPFASAKRDVLLPVIEEPEFTERMPVASNDVDQTGKASFLIDLESYGNAQKFFSRLSEIVFADQQGAALKQQKVLQELEKAAKKLHALKFEKELEKLDAASADFKNAGAEEKMAVVRLKNEGWKTLAKQFQQQVGEVKIEMNKIANLDIIESDQYNREVRQPVSANVEKVRGFSFEFSEAPRVKINLPIIYQRQPKRLDKKKSAACEEDSYKEMRIDELPDRSSVRPVTKRIMVIRI